MAEVVENRDQTAPQRGAVDAAEATRNALVEAREHLFRALARPQPGRERKWAERVGAGLWCVRGCGRHPQDGGYIAPHVVLHPQIGLGDVLQPAIALRGDLVESLECLRG